MKLQCRQGDVLLVRIPRTPPSAVKKKSEEKRIVLAYGEATGHAHAIASDLAKMFILGTHTYIDVMEGARLRHEEHAAIELEPGSYEVILQRQYVDPIPQQQSEWYDYNLD